MTSTLLSESRWRARSTTFAQSDSVLGRLRALDSKLSVQLGGSRAAPRPGERGAAVAAAQVRNLEGILSSRLPPPASLVLRACLAEAAFRHTG